jgi:hypothetical protein
MVRVWAEEAAMKPVHWGTAIGAVLGLDVVIRREESLIVKLIKALGG